MDNRSKKTLKNYFQKEFAGLILEKLESGHRLSKFKINPFILISLSSGVFGQPTSMNMAKALLYPRVFGTSINTTFGDKMQKLCVQFLGAQASGTAGMDIEFTDKTEKQHVIMQLKAGPNTINSGDVEPILQDMHKAYRLLQQNRIKNMPTFAIGITYGTTPEISGHYKRIQSSPVGGQTNIPIYIGQNFWYRLTGNPKFYAEMLGIFIEVFEQENYSTLLEKDLKSLSAEIEKKYFTKGKFDQKKV